MALAGGEGTGLWYCDAPPILQAFKEDTHCVRVPRWSAGGNMQRGDNVHFVKVIPITRISRALLII